MRPPRHDGWPDWRGQTVAILASGPSVKKANLKLLDGRCRVIAIKQTFELYPQADIVYGCDPAWWRHRRGLPEYAGLKITWAGSRLDEFPDIRRVNIPKNPHGGFAEQMLFETAGTVGGGGNSGFQAINLAAQFGAARILLIGLDMSDAGGVHWYGRNNWSQANNPDETAFRRWTGSLLKAAPVLKARGVEVIDCSLQGALHCFPKVALEEVDLDRL